MLFAYLDPGTGSMIAQAAIGISVAVGVVVKTYWVKIKAAFGGKSKSSDDLRVNKSENDER